MRGTRSICVAIRSALVFAAFPLAPRFAHAQSKQEIRIYAGGELGGTHGDQGSFDLAPVVGVAYSPIRFLSFGVVGAYGVGGSGACAVSGSDSGGGCSLYAPYRVTVEVEVDPFDRVAVEPFFVAVGGVFGERDSVYGQNSNIAPVFGAGAGLHFFPIDFLSIDVALRVLYVDFPDHFFGSVWGVFSIGATPRIRF
jgi:hypothetical protein